MFYEPKNQRFNLSILGLSYFTLIPRVKYKKDTDELSIHFIKKAFIIQFFGKGNK